MALPTFNKSLYSAKKSGKISMAGKWPGSSEEPEEDKTTLKDMIEDRFRDDRRLVAEIELYLHILSKKRQRPTIISWGMQLDTLKKFPKNRRLEQVQNSIRGGYKQIAYEDNLKKYKNESIQQTVVAKHVSEDDRHIRYDRAF